LAQVCALDPPLSVVAVMMLQVVRLVAVAILAAASRTASGQTACAYRCDPSWPGLDTGACSDAETCWDTMDSYVTDSLCWGLPFQPGPGDILLHDQVPFESQEACEAYIATWQNKQALKGNGTRANASAASPLESDKVSFEDRGKTWSGVTHALLAKCVGIGGEHAELCPGWSDVLRDGLTGKQLQDCINACLLEFGEEELEHMACEYALSETGPAAGVICEGIEKFLLEPVNKFVNKYIEEPIVHACEKVEDAIGGALHKIGCWLGFCSGTQLAAIVV